MLYKFLFISKVLMISDNCIRIAIMSPINITTKCPPLIALIKCFEGFLKTIQSTPDPLQADHWLCGLSAVAKLVLTNKKWHY